MAKVTFKLDSGFRSFVRVAERQTAAALEASLQHGAKVARELAPEEEGELKAGIHATRVGRQGARGFAGEIDGDAQHTLYQEAGVLGGRRGKLKQPERRRRGAGKGSGIKAKRFLAAGLKAAQAKWPEEMERRFRG